MWPGVCRFVLEKSSFHVSQQPSCRLITSNHLSYYDVIDEVKSVKLLYKHPKYNRFIWRNQSYGLLNYDCKLPLPFPLITIIAFCRLILPSTCACDTSKWSNVLKEFRSSLITMNRIEPWHEYWNAANLDWLWLPQNQRSLRRIWRDHRATSAFVFT